jgi:hypothetical protein
LSIIDISNGKNQKDITCLLSLDFISVSSDYFLQLTDCFFQDSSNTRNSFGDRARRSRFVDGVVVAGDTAICENGKAC